MKKNYERPEAEVISFAAMEQLASLKTQIDSMNIKLDVEGEWSIVDQI